MNVLIIGGGGREHALAWKLKQSSTVQQIFIAPGNAGTSSIAQNIPFSEMKDILVWIKKNPVDLVIVGPDEHLALGVVDAVEKLGIPIFGPTQAASEIEWSKSFAKQFMKEEGIPTAKYETFSDSTKAKAYIQSQTFPVVIKASGLAFGKGVIIAQNISEAEKALDEIMNNKVFGSAGDEIIIEEYLEGKEISIHSFCDGDNAILFPPAQDHKRIFENDEGPNTGGMGTIAPVPWVTEDQMRAIEEKVVIPTLKALKKRGRLFKGILFPGIMITENGPKVIEFNARFGDPETQSYMRILETDLVDIICACLGGRLLEQKIRWSKETACCIVAVSDGYPGQYEKKKIILGLENKVEDMTVFHAATQYVDGQIVSNGGRVLGITAVGNSLKESLHKAYTALDTISFEGMKYRKDIGLKSIDADYL